VAAALHLGLVADRDVDVNLSALRKIQMLIAIVVALCLIKLCRWFLTRAHFYLKD
jgi:hypothetical protein